MKEAKSYDDDFARLYDLFVYAQEAVEAGAEEIAFLKWAFDELCPREVRDVLDVGCGTGRHVVPIAREGYAITGLDNSAGMIAEARRRLAKHGLFADLVQRDMADLDLEGRFDAVLCMNSAIDHLLTTQKIVGALERFRQALRPSGILVLDSWNFFAQWHRFDNPHSDVRSGEGVLIDYHDSHWYDSFTSVYHIEMAGTVHEGDKTYEVRAEHALRAMTVGERKTCLRDAGFINVSVYPNFASRTEEAPPNAERVICVGLRPEDGESQ